MKYNNEFKTIDTEEKAYFLGQAFGDGCNILKPKGYKFTMASIDTDTELYQKLQTCFPFLKFKQYSSHSNMVYLESYEKEFCLDLANLGLVSSKTKNDKTLTFHFPNLREDLIPHFIRGYFDADGSAWFPNRKRSRNSLHIEFGCATPNFLNHLKKVLDENGLVFSFTSREKKAGNGKYYMSYILFSSNRNLSIQFADYIYKDAHLYLERKKDICYTPIDLRPTAFSIYGICPDCGSVNITRKGTRGKSQRLSCKDCNRQFSKLLNNADSDSNI